MSKKSLFGKLSLLAASFLVIVICVSSAFNNAEVRDEGQETAEAPAPDPGSCKFRAGETYFEVYDGQRYVPVYLKGVNLGSGKPGSFPGELAITGSEYVRWFQMISDMNCNAIRVYTIMKPAFYDALCQFNEASDRKLYLFQGLWYDEEIVYGTSDAYEVYEEACKDGRLLVDVLHGNAEIARMPGRAWGKYTSDVSPYVMGWILGIEPETPFVMGTNEAHDGMAGYTGTYLQTTQEASPYESFLCQLGDTILTYEMDNYHEQRPMSWCNWPTTDPLTHENEPNRENEDAVSVDTEHIRATDKFAAGVFASYHIYPYYPEFMMYEPEYAQYVDEKGEHNTYRAYLEDLIRCHTTPVMVAEYGIPTSRGITHVNTVTGYNQGGVTEEEQGRMLVSMSEDIYETGYCGGFVFTWQDEWFKRTWNTMDYSNPDRRPYWSDIQTSEQNYGLLSFDEGKTVPGVILDGDISEWKTQDVVAEGDTVTLSAMKDSRYLYLMVRGDDFAPETDRVVIPVDVTPNSGASGYQNRGSFRFEGGRPDFVIDLWGRKNSRIKVQRYYDRYGFQYGKMDKGLRDEEFCEADSDEFVLIRLCLNKELKLPLTGEVIPFQKYETGRLRYGNGAPHDEQYDSLADFCYGENCIEIRIPWLLLNFRDPSTKEIEDDFWKNGDFSGIYVDEIGLGVGTDGESICLQPFTWGNWNQIAYHERLKQSYNIMKECYAKLP